MNARTAAQQIVTLSLHDALPISATRAPAAQRGLRPPAGLGDRFLPLQLARRPALSLRAGMTRGSLLDHGPVPNAAQAPLDCPGSKSIWCQSHVQKSYSHAGAA